MEFHLPKMSTGYAYYPTLSLFPNLWAQTAGYWSPAMGKTGNYLPDWTGMNNITGTGATINTLGVAQGATATITGIVAAGTVNITGITAGTQGKMNILGITPGTPAQLNVSAISAGTTATINITAVIGTVALYTATVSGGVIQTLTTTNAGGAGYTAGQYLTVYEASSGNNAVVQVNTIGGGGAIATFTIINGGTGYTTAAGGCGIGLIGGITAATIVTQGTGYVVGQVVPVSGAGTNATITVLTVTTTNILTFAINNPGTNYVITSPVNLTASGSITTVNATPVAGGSNYVATQLVPYLPYYGTGATFNITAAAGVVQATPTIVAAGSGYAIGQVINIVQNGGTGAQLTITSVNASGNITSVSLLAGGTGYVTATPLGVTPVVNGTAYITVSTISGGAISTFAQTSNGTAGYMVNATTFMASSGPVTSVSLNTAGTQYYPGQTYAMTQGPSSSSTVVVATVGGTAATFNITAVDLQGRITALTLASGGTSYTNGQVVSILQAGSNNSAYITINQLSGSAIQYFTLTYGGTPVAPGSPNGAGYTVANGVSTSQAGNILTLGALVAGTGYVVGTGAINVATIPTSGPITTVSIQTGGQGYQPGQVLNIAQGNLDGTATVTVTTVTAGGVISGISLTGGGTGYFNQSPVPTSLPPQGVATGISVGLGGTGYQVGQIIQIPGGTFYGNIVTTVSTVSAGGVITAFGAMLSGGSGYGSGATFSCTAIAGVIQATPTVNGGGLGYLVGQQLNIVQASSSGAIVQVATINPLNGAILTVTLIAGGTGYTTNASLAVTYNVTSGLLNGIGIANAGTGYSIWEQISIVEPGGVGATAIISGINGTGGITSLSLQNPGTGYTTANANISAIGATASINILGIATGLSINWSNTGGAISAPAVYSGSGGSGYYVGQLLNMPSSQGTGGILQVTSTSGTAATFTTTVIGGAINVLTLTQGGAHYVVGQVLNIIQGGNKSAYLTVNTAPAGVIATWTVNNTGSGYSAGAVSVTNSGWVDGLSVYAGGFGFTSGSGIGSLFNGIPNFASLNAGGTNYLNNSVVPIVQSGTIFGASITVTSINGGTGAITGFNLNLNGGQGYSVAGAVPLATGVVTGVTLASGGTGYLTNQFLNLLPSPTAINCLFNVFVSGGQVTSVTVANSGGSGYVAGQILNIPGGTYDATAVVTAVSTGAITGIVVASPGTSGYTASGATPIFFTTGIVVKVLVASGGIISSISAVTGGQSYPLLNNVSLSTVTGFSTLGLLKPLGVFSNPSGAGATISATTSGGVITSLSVNAAGTGYLVGQYLSIVQSSVITGAYGTVTAVNTVGGITGFNFLFGGTGSPAYSNGTIPLVNIAPTWSSTASNNGHSLTFPFVPYAGFTGVTLGKTGNFPSSTTGFTAMIWFNTVDQFNITPLFLVTTFGGANSPGSLFFTFNPSANGGLGQFQCGGVFATTAEWDLNANNTNTAVNTTTLCNGKWHCLMITCNPLNTTTSLYCDNQLVGTTTGTFFYNMGTGNPILLGSNGNNFPVASWNCGDVGLWNRVLDPTEMAQLYFGASPLTPFIPSSGTPSNYSPQQCGLQLEVFNGYPGTSWNYTNATLNNGSGYQNIISGNLGNNSGWQWQSIANGNAWQLDFGLGNSAIFNNWLFQQQISYGGYMSSGQNPGYIYAYLQACNDGASWVTLDQFTVPYTLPTLANPQPADQGLYYIRPLSNIIPYRYWRVYLPQSIGGYNNCWNYISVGAFGTNGAIMFWGTKFVTKSASYKAPAFTISSTLNTPTPFHGALYSAPSFTITTSNPAPIAGKIIKFNASAFTITTTFNHPTVNHDYKFSATPFTIVSSFNAPTLGGTNLTFPAAAILNATSIVNVGTKLFAVTNTTPAMLAVFDISTPTAPTWVMHTLTGAADATDIIYNSVSGILYVACASGKIVEVTESTPGTFTVYSSGASGNLTSLAQITGIKETYAGTDWSTGETIAFIEATTSTIGMSINFNRVGVATLGTTVNTLNGAFVGMQIDFVQTLTPSIACYIAFLAASYADLSLTPIGRPDIEVYIGGTLVPDVKLDSIEITHTCDNKSEATFILARKHDNVDYVLNPDGTPGTYLPVTGNPAVTITINGNEEFGYDTNAYVWDIDTKSETETVKITCYSELPKQDERSTVNLSIPGINEQLHVYHALVNNPTIDNPIIQPDDINPPFYLGILIDTGYTTTQRVTQLQGFSGVTEDQKVNYVLGSGDSGVYDYLGNPQYFKPVQNWSYFWFGLATNFLTGASWVGLAEMGSSYLGSSPSSLTSDAWDVTFIDWWYERQFPDTVTRGTGGDSAIVYPSDYIGVVPTDIESAIRNHTPTVYSGADIMAMKFAIARAENPYAQNPSNPNAPALDGDISQYGTGFVPSDWTTDTIDLIDSKFGYHWGSAPYKKVSCKSGILNPAARWVDKSDGLYNHTPAGFNYTAFVQAIGTLEYTKIRNINGSVLPKTKCEVEMFLDGYYHYDIQLLKRINIDNTTEAGIYDSNNGFPVSVKTIHISSKTMRVTLSCSNQWSRIELLELESARPDSSKYVIREKWQFLTPKFDPNTLLNTN